MNIQVDVEEIESTYILRIHGRLDTVTIGAVEQKIHQLMKPEGTKILADFTNFEYLSSAGLRLLLSTTKKLRAQGGRFVVFSIHDDALDIIKMAGFERVLKICKNEQEALQAVG